MGTGQIMHALLSQPSPADDPLGEYTRVHRRIRRPTLAIAQLEYHLFVPRRAHAPLLEDAYEVWRDCWRATFEELEGRTQIHSDEFTRQDEIGVLTFGGRCISVTGLRWLDLSLARSREDSYFRLWPADSLAALGKGIIGISSNAVVHRDWRGSVVTPAQGSSAQPARLAHVAVGLTIQRFFESSAESSVAVTRNDRGMDRVCLGLGATALSRIEMHGVGSDVMHFPRNCVCRKEPVLDALWTRRYQW